MKNNSLKILALSTLLIVIIYAIYKYTLVPDQLREHYGVSEIQIENAPISEEAKAEIKEEVKAIAEAKIDESVKADLYELNRLELQVKKRAKECSNDLEGHFADNNYIDPNIDFYKSPENIFATTEMLFKDVMKRKEATDSLSQLKKIVFNDTKIDPVAYKSRVETYMVCFDARIFNFFETIMEVAAGQKWSPELKNSYSQIILNRLKDVIAENRGMPDSVQLTLGLLKSLEAERFIGRESNRDLDSLMEDISQFEITLMDQFGGRSGYEQNYALLKDYLTQYETYSDQVLSILEDIIRTQSTSSIQR